jgi:hypothetical protein
MKWKACVVWFCTAATLLARNGAVETRDGKLYEGAIRFYPDSVIVANARRDFIAHIPTTNVLELTFQKEEERFVFPDPWGEIVSPDGNLPFPWKNVDIGKSRIRGNAEYVGSVIRLYSGGVGFSEEMDACHYLYKPVKGDSEIVARVVHIQRPDSNAKAGIMMRESLAENARQVSLTLMAGHAGEFSWREQPAERLHRLARPELVPPYWIKMRRDADTFTAFKSENGRTWTLLHQVPLPMKQDVFVGLSAAGFGEDFLSRATIDNLKEAPSVPVTPWVPTIQLLSGSTMSGRLSAFTNSSLMISGVPERRSVALNAVANVLFQWLPGRYSWLLNSGRKGALLTSGEFVEGDLFAIENGKVVISSVLFGLNFYRMDSEIVALVLQKPLSVKSQVEVRTTDGSAWMGTGMEIADNEIVLREPGLGKHIIPIYDLAEIRCQP